MADLQAFGIHDLVAYRNRQVLTVSFSLTRVSNTDEVSEYVVVSVWQKVRRVGRHKGCSHSHYCHEDTWLLVSENSSLIDPR